MDQIKIGKFISELRKSKNMTQQQLAEKIGVSFKTVSKWETGRGMPELSTLKPLSDELGITINELLNGEKIKKEEYLNKLEENMIATIDYSDKKINEKDKNIGIFLLIIGLLISLAAVSIFSSESSWSSIYSVLGSIISLIGFSKIIKKLSYIKRVILNFSFFAIFIALLFILDFTNVTINHQPPRFSLTKVTTDKVITYTTPFYNVYRINVDTKNEYYIIDTKKQYNIDTIPISPFNRERSGIDNITKYCNKYVGNNSNDGALINSLPLSEYGFVFEIDSENLGLIVDYHITDWYINDEELYLEKCLIYNSVSIFSLIENTQYIEYNFTGNSYKITRETIEKNYPNYDDIFIDNKIDKDSFNRLVENKMNDNEFVNKTFEKMFDETTNKN